MHDLQPALAELQRSADINKTNIPINVKEGNVQQAKLEKKNLKSFQAAISLLGRVARPLKT